MKMKNITKLGLLILTVIVLSSGVFATNGLDIDSVEINGKDYDVTNTASGFTWNDGRLRVELGSEFDIDVKLRANSTTNHSDVEVSARMVGYDHADKEKLRVYDVVVVDEMMSNDVEYFKLNLDAPKSLDKTEDSQNYYLRIRVLGQGADYGELEIPIDIVGEDNLIDIVRVSFDPAQVIAGRALRTRVKLKNLGEEDEDDVYVTVSIPALGPSMVTSADIDELEEDETLTTEDLLLRIPKCAPEGVYAVEVTVEYDDGYESTSDVKQVVILADEACALSTTPATPETETGRTIITPPQSQDLVAGESGASYPIVIKNEGTSDKVYSVSVEGVTGWGSAEVTNPAPLIKAGETEVVYIYVSANDNAEGKQVFDIVVSDGKDSRKVPVSAEIIEASSKWDIENVLLVGIIILLALVIILGLIVGFGKAKGDNDKEYY